MVSPLYLALSQAAYACFLLAFLNVGRRWLHGLAFLGSALAIFYCFQADQEPLWVPLGWHVAFAAVNGIALFVNFAIGLWRNRKKGPKVEKLDKLEEFCKRTVFAHFPEADMIGFLRLGVEGRVEKGQTVLKAGEGLSELYCVVQGTASGFLKQAKQQDYPPGRLIGETLLLGSNRATLDVIAQTDLRLLAWSPEIIENWTTQDPKNLSLLQAAVGAQLVEQMLEQTRQATAKNEKTEKIEKTRAA